MGELVLVTGASTYVGAHVVQQLMWKKYSVRGTVKNLKDEVEVKPVKALGGNGSLELIEADALDTGAWPAALADCKYVIHIASPFPDPPEEEDEQTAGPIVEGMMNVVRACADCKTIKRVVLTSSGYAVFGNNNLKPGTFLTEADWTNTENDVGCFAKSKTIGEKAAWDFWKTLPEDDRFELTTMNPCYILGPVLGNASSAGIELMQKLMEHDISALPAVQFQVVDVRDVANAHVIALTEPEAAGQRHLLCTSNLWLKDISKILHKEFKKQGYSIPTSSPPYAMLWIMSHTDKNIKAMMPLVGQEFSVDNTRFLKVLNVRPYYMENTVTDMAYNLVDTGRVKRSSKYKGKPQA